MMTEDKYTVIVKSWQVPQIEEEVTAWSRAEAIVTICTRHKAAIECLEMVTVEVLAHQ
jgi:hypothetical protein